MSDGAADDSTCLRLRALTGTLTCLGDSLTLATRALEAQTVGLDVVGQNMANVNTPGYSRREVDLVEVPPYDPLSAGGGVQVRDIRAVRDQLLERRYRDELPD